MYQMGRGKKYRYDSNGSIKKLGKPNKKEMKWTSSDMKEWPGEGPVAHEI